MGGALLCECCCLIVRGKEAVALAGLSFGSFGIAVAQPVALATQRSSIPGCKQPAATSSQAAAAQCVERLQYAVKGATGAHPVKAPLEVSVGRQRPSEGLGVLAGEKARRSDALDTVLSWHKTPTSAAPQCWEPRCPVLEAGQSFQAGNSLFKVLARTHVQWWDARRWTVGSKDQGPPNAAAITMHAR